MNAATLLAACQTLVFDLDGTLIDTAADIRATLSLALQDCGLPALASGEIPPDMYSPLRGIVAAQLASKGQDSALVNDVVRAYEQRFARQPHATSQPYPGVSRYLASRLRGGCRLAVCTNKRHANAVAVLAHFDLLQFFSHVVGSDSTAHAKPDPAPLMLALKLLQADPAESLLIGDSHVDASCAQRSGVGFVWFRPAYPAGAVLQQPVSASFVDYAELEQSPQRGGAMHEAANSTA
jgi:phosphoglycolate phosphatase